MYKFGSKIFNLAVKLWPINRSITGDGVRETLAIIKSEIPNLDLFEVATGTKIFDWVVPREWKVNNAYIETPSGKKICEFKLNNLHLVGYSIPFQGLISLEELQSHLHSLPDQPSWIPYVTSYYKDYWGFCITDIDRQSLTPGTYRVVVDTELFDGSLTYGELIIKGQSEEEIFISTYICHPSMANNELTGPTVTTFIAKWLSELPQRRYTYRIIFIPETIGSICYLSTHLDHLKKYVKAGFNVTCIGDERSYSYLPSRNGDTLSDKVAQHILKWIDSEYKSYCWADRGSDERQYCAPNIDLPIASIMRSKYGEYPEYHTSADNLSGVVTPNGLEGGFNALKRALEALEKNVYPLTRVLGEPQLSKRNLYPSLSTKSKSEDVDLMMNLITWSDGKTSLLEIAELCQTPIWNLYPVLKILEEHGLMDQLKSPLHQ